MLIPLSNASFLSGYFFLSDGFLGKPCSLACFMVMIPGRKDLTYYQMFAVWFHTGPVSLKAETAKL